MHSNTILEIDVISGEGKCPGRRGRCEEWHGNTETDFGSHVAYGLSYRRGEVIDHKSDVEFGVVEVCGWQISKWKDEVKYRLSTSFQGPGS